VISGGFDTSVQIWDDKSQKTVGVIRLKFKLSSISVNENKGLLAIGLEDGSVQLWQRKDDTWEHWQFKWSSTYPSPALFLSDCDVTGVKGLSNMNHRLLEQRGAITIKAKIAQLTQLSEEYYFQGDIISAINCYKQLIELNPEDTHAFHNLGCCYHVNGELQQAAESFQKAIKLRSYAGVHCEYGLLLFRQEHYDDAISQFLKVIELKNDMSGLMYGVLEKPLFDDNIQHEIDEGSYIEIKPVYMAYYLLIQCYTRKDDAEVIEKAMREFKEIVDAQSEALIYRIMGDTYQHLNQEDMADEYFEKAFDITIDDDSEEESLLDCRVRRIDGGGDLGFRVHGNDGSGERDFSVRGNDVGDVSLAEQSSTVGRFSGSPLHNNKKDDNNNNAEDFNFSNSFDS